MTDFIAIINSTPGALIEIPQDKRYVQKNTEMIFDTKYYTKCCNQISLCNVMCNKCDKIVEKGKKYFVYIPVEQQIKKSLVDNFEEILNYINRSRSSETITDIDDGCVQKQMNDQYPDKKILSFTLNIDGGVISEKSTKS